MLRRLCLLFMLALVLGAASDAGAELLAHWKLDEGAGTDVTDASGNGYGGVLMGDPTWTTGMFKGALEFDGDGDYVDFGNPADWPAGDAPRSLTGWGLTYAVNGVWRWIAAYGSEGTYLACFIGSNGTSLYGGGYGDDVYTTNFWEVNEWHHVALTYDGTTARLYGDGVEVDAQPKSWNTTLGRAHLGQQVNNYNEFWYGLIDDVRLFDHVLSVEEIQDVMAGVPPELARDPSPEDAAVDVPRDGVLAWVPGELAASHDVYMGTVLEDVENASRSAPGAVLVSRGQSGLTYDHGRLDFSQTYYWRVDEVSAAPDNTIYQGQVWSFTVEPLAYPIAGVIATSNGTSEAEAGPENAVNGSGLNANDEHSTESEDMWVGVPAGADPLYIQFEFDQVYQLHEMLVWNYNVQFEMLLGFGIKDATVEYSENGTDWTTLGDVELARATARADYVANTMIDLQGAAARYVRLTVNSGYGTMGQFGLSEVRFLYTPANAREPQPADGETGVNPNGMLSWRAGREAGTHEIYLSDDEAVVADGTALVDSISESSYSLGALDLQYDSTYYWKIVEVNEAETISAWEGSVWSFVTQEFGVVDDFESYNDEDSLIYETWIDGWVNETGSTVGHLESPFAETSIVHGGRQSMPLMYDNNGGLMTSEGDRTFESPQDWTGNGIQSLSLYFRGTTANSGGQLYLKINDTKIVYDGDAGDLSQAVWHAWNVDLSAVAGNIQSVTKLTIGIEGAGAQGMLYIDDISLYPKAVEYITPTEPDSANLVGQWSLDGNANDSSGNGYHGTEMNGPTYVTGIDGQAMKFDGVDDYVDFGNPADWPSGAEPRTMSFWATTNSVDAGYRFAVSYGSAGTGQAMFIGINGTTLYGGGYGDDVTVADFWVMGEWHHLGLTYDGTTARLYADGIEVAAAAKTWGLVLGRAHIGQQVNDFFEFWNGTVDEVRIYSAALSAGEVAWLAGRTAPMHKPF
ncbi:MAG: discoidin domain-containing protein [Phycisphaerales bacterium]|nr:MAG: discoidin domain-containing protein [Phycisphaerales bacterium]